MSASAGAVLQAAAGGEQLGAAAVRAGGLPGAGVNPGGDRLGEAPGAEGGLPGAGVGAVDDGQPRAEAAQHRGAASSQILVNLISDADGQAAVKQLS